MRRLRLLVSLVSGALVISSSVQRLILQATVPGRLQATHTVSAIEDLQTLNR